MKKFFNEFKEFAVKGNVVDLAVAVIMGGAFGAIVTSLVNDIIMPPIGLLLGGVDFSKLAIVLKEASGDVPAVTINYGNFINIVLTFIIVALAMFLIIKGLNSMKKEEEAAPADPTTKECPHCCTEIPIKATRCPHCTSKLDS
ncbi:MAG: large-conductance mechanosensitive channel protein MscL [Anaerolineae bacterium]|jgi:large conductance mechanosensitive channel|nr:large-conductance mechanosensitive channel protein MscL [Anaerolineae bacterium]